MHPKHLAEAIENSCSYYEKYPLNHTIQLSIYDEVLEVVGFTRWTRVADRRPFDSITAEEGATRSLIVGYTEALELVKSGVRKVQGFASKGANITLRIDAESPAEGFLEVVDGDQVVGRLEAHESAEMHAGDAEHIGTYEHLLNLEDEAELGQPYQMAMLKELLVILGKLKMSRTDETGKWTSAQAEDKITTTALKEYIVAMEYESVTCLHATAGLVELEDT